MDSGAQFVTVVTGRAGAKRPTRFGVRKKFYEEIRYGQFIRRHRWHR